MFLPPPTLVATLTERAELDAVPMSLLERVGVLEVRADLVGDLEPETLRERFSGRLLYTLRSREEWGCFGGGAAERQQRLRWAAERYDLVDLELERDLDHPLSSALPPARRLLSWHGRADSVGELQQRLGRMDEVDAALRKIVPSTLRSGDEVRALELMAAEQRPDLTTFATGELGQWTRVLAAFLGAPLVYGSLAERPAAPGQPSIAELVSEYDLPNVFPLERVYGIVGNPVAHSLSPRLHNWAYRALGLPALYLRFFAETFADFWLEVVESGVFQRLGVELAGLSVTTPFKEPALAVASVSSPRAQAIGGANTLFCPRGAWEAESTDPEGVVAPLRWRGVFPPRAAAVVGCGGAGRAAALGLREAGFEVTLVNRGADRGRAAAEALHLEWQPLEVFDAARFDVVVQATTLGRSAGDPLPFDPQALRSDAVLVELVYGAGATPLGEAARARGVVVIGGREVLLGQAIDQFRLLTGAELPLAGAAEVLGIADRLGATGIVAAEVPR